MHRRRRGVQKAGRSTNKAVSGRPGCLVFPLPLPSARASAWTWLALEWSTCARCTRACTPSCMVCELPPHPPGTVQTAYGHTPVRDWRFLCLVRLDSQENTGRCGNRETDGCPQRALCCCKNSSARARRGTRVRWSLPLSILTLLAICARVTRVVPTWSMLPRAAVFLQRYPC